MLAWDDAVAQRYQVPGTPLFVVVDGQGVITAGGFANTQEVIDETLNPAYPDNLARCFASARRHCVGQSADCAGFWATTAPRRHSADGLLLHTLLDGVLLVRNLFDRSRPWRTTHREVQNH